MKKIDKKHSNKITNRLSKPVVLTCLALSFLTACGQRGSLYIPTAPEAAQRSTIVDTLTKPAPASHTPSDTNSAPAK